MTGTGPNGVATMAELVPATAARRPRREPHAPGPLLDVRGLKTSFHTRDGVVRAVDGIDFHVDRGEIMGLVGESGCGKTTTANMLMGLLTPTAGRVTLHGHQVGGRSRRELARMRREMQMIFQDPYSSLNPRKTVGSIIAEPFVIHKLNTGGGERKRAVQELMEQVGLNPEHYNRYPHAFSGGQR